VTRCVLTLFERISGEIAAQSKQTGVPKEILQKVYDRGTKDSEVNDPEVADACGKARVAAFVRGGTAREKDSDEWQRYQDQPDQTEQSAREGGSTPTLPGNETPVKSAGVFIPLPETLARYFPRKPEDTSTPHVTLLFIGPLTPDDERKVVEVVRKVADQWPPFRTDLALYSEFKNAEGVTIAHMVPTATICLSQRDGIYRGLAHLHADLYAALDDAGIEVQHNYGGEKFGTYDDRVATYKPHATLAYVPAGERYEGHRPTGSWQVTEIEVWGSEHYRIPLGLHVDRFDPDLTHSPTAEDVQVAEEDAEDHAEDVGDVAEPEDLDSPGQAEAQTATTSDIEDTFKLVLPQAPADQLETEPLAAQVVEPEPASRFHQSPPESTTDRPAQVETVVPAVNAIPFSLPTFSVRTGSTAKATVVADQLVRPPLQLERTPLQSEEKSGNAPRSPAGPWNPARIAESYGLLEGSVLIYGSGGEHDFAEFDPTLSEDEDTLAYVQRKWDTVLCCPEPQASAVGCISTLLAARGLLRSGGQAVLALQSDASVVEWEKLASKFFETKRLPTKRGLFLRLRPTDVFTEQARAEAAIDEGPRPIQQTQLPPIHVGPVILHLPEREVQLTAPIHVTLPELPAPQVNIAAGAIKVDVHQPPPVKKRVVMSKDPFGKVTGELEVIEDTPRQLPEFPDVSEIIGDRAE